ncbi:4'-phosphopantetheinyl transferase family protein [Streptomyces lunaelactis]|uniref:4'-phosphopantetheinyl transferase family protein n=2 Tax=Streptomyces lunaelactis TaxID=1535768 RepID=UPI0028164F89|nr:4'-phosphopantetheinyl transferase superfamily protein [Streptomyces lunaelactis]
MTYAPARAADSAAAAVRSAAEEWAPCVDAFVARGELPAGTDAQEVIRAVSLILRCDHGSEAECAQVGESSPAVNTRRPSTGVEIQMRDDMVADVPAGSGPATTLPGVELLWSGRVPDLAEDAAAHRHLLDAEESVRLEAFRLAVDRDAYTVAHVALRRMLGERLGQAPEAVTMTRRPCTHCGGPHGRPVVPGNAVHFSLSHTSGLVLIALASVPVGVDVEAVPEPGMITEVAAQLHPRERTELAAAPAEQHPAAFARCWTRKEALLKATGVGLNEDLSHTYVGAGAQPAAGADWLLADLPADPGYAAAVAVHLRQAPASGVEQPRAPRAQDTQ